MTVSCVMGGDFDIDLSMLEHSKNYAMPDGYYYSSGRAALFQILSHIKETRKDIQTIFIPDYICPSVPQTITAAGYKWATYPLGRNFCLDEDGFKILSYSSSVVIVVNYYGMTDTYKTIDFLRQLDSTILVIEDNVQSLFSMFKEMKSDYAFTSFRKTIAMPDGGWVKSNKKLNSIEGDNIFTQYKVAGAILKHYRRCGYYDDSIYTSLLAQGEKLINGDLQSGMSKVSRKLWPLINLQVVGTRRKANADFLITQLHELGITPLLTPTSDDIPLFIPIVVEERNKLRKLLFDNNIFCPVHWPLSEEYQGMRMGNEMAQYELSLIIDQRYSIADMQRMMVIIKDFYGKN